MKINFVYDLEKDLYNYDNNYIHSNFPDYGREKMDVAKHLFQSVKEKIEKAPDVEKLQVVENYLRSKYLGKEVITQSISALQNYWSTINDEYFERLNKYMEISKPLDEVTVYLTTLGICPYDPKHNTFFVSLYYPLPQQAKTIMHESMHLVFRHNYEAYLKEKGINNQGILEITESLTVLLNWEFGDLLLLPENNNKPTTFDLQKEVVELYRQKKNFKEILDRLIELRI